MVHKLELKSSPYVVADEMKLKALKILVLLDKMENFMKLVTLNICTK